MQAGSLFENRLVRLGYALVLSVLSMVLLNPYKFGLYDHWYMLAWLTNLDNPEIFAIDPVIAQREYHYSILYKLLSSIPLPDYLSFLLVYTVCLVAIFYISMAIHRLYSKQWVYLTPLLLVVPWFTPGTTFTIPTLLLMRISGFPFLLAGIHAWLRQKSLLAWILVGIAFLFHPATGLYVAAFLGVNLLIDPEKRGRIKEWFKVMAFVVLSLPVFIQKFSAPDTGFTSFIADEYWLETIRIRSAHHAFPDAWHSWDIYSAGCLLLILVLGSIVVRESKLRRFLAATTIATVIIYICGLLFTYVWPAYLGIQVQPFRVARIMMFLSLMFVPVIWLKTSKKFPWIYHLVLAGLLCAAGYLQTRFLFFYNFTLTLPLWTGFYLPRFRKYAPAFLLITAFVVFDNHSFTAPKITNELPEERQELYTWIRQNTDINSLWVIPSDMMYFRNHAQRSALATWWDGTFGYFDYNYNRDWRNRYEAIYGELNYKRREPQMNDWSELAKLTRPFAATEVYVLKTEPADSPVLEMQWQGDGFYIYRFTGKPAF